MAFSLVFFVSLYKRRVLQNQLRVQEMQTSHQREMLKATLTSQEDERNRLGTELHDGVGAMLSTIKMNLQVSQRANSLKTLPEVIEHLMETIGLVRTISHEMMPIVLKKYGLRRAIIDLFEKISNSDEVTASINTWCEFEREENENLMLYRIIQELTNNSLKHSQAKNIKLECKVSEETATIIFFDDGKGFPPEVLEKSEGIGLWNISNRAVAIGADVVFSNNMSGSAEVELNIKLNKPND